MAKRKRGPLSMLGDLAGALTPLAVRDLSAEIADRLRKVPTRVNEFGFDDYGMEIASVQRSVLPAALLYRWYFRARDLRHRAASRRAACC